MAPKAESACPYHQTATVDASPAAKCPFNHGKKQLVEATTNGDWWPNQIDLRHLSQDPSSARPSSVPHPTSSTVSSKLSSPREATTYKSKFESIDLRQLRRDVHAAITTSNPAWPADYGTYAPLMVRLAWHSAGTYRVFDGRGGGNSGNIRLAPLNSWPDNANLDKARNVVLWPVKKKYGSKLSWADLIILAGNVAIESMMGEDFESVEPLWFGGGRVDAFAPETDVYWGIEKEWLQDERHGDAGGELEEPLSADQMGLIYVNPEGPGGNPDIQASGRHILSTFGRMGMNARETVALIAGGHTFGKAHGAAPDSHVGPEPEGAPIENLGMGWKSDYGSGKGKDTITSGLEGAWTAHPDRWDHGFFTNLYRYDWEQTKSPAGAIQWTPTDESIERNGGLDAATAVVDAHVDGLKHLPIMFTSDLALRYDPVMGPISEEYHAYHDIFTEEWKRAWYKLCHRDMGPKSRHLGPYVPKEDMRWQDPIPEPSSAIDVDDVANLKATVLKAIDESKASVSDLVKAAWASASTYRCTDHRGGANGGRVRLEPQTNWVANDPSSLAKVVTLLEGIQADFNSKSSRQVSFADLVVLAGGVAVEHAAKKAGSEVTVPFVPGRTDASQDATDVESFNKALKPSVDGFRNYNESSDRPEHDLFDRAHLLSLSAPETVALVGGLRVLNANSDNMQVGVLTERPGVLDASFFENILDLSTDWAATGDGKLYLGTRADGGRPWVASRVDLAMASNSQLRAISEVYASDDGKDAFVQDFVDAFAKVMNLDRFDLLA